MSKRFRWMVLVLSGVAILVCCFALARSGDTVVSNGMAQNLLQSWRSATPPIASSSKWSVEGPREMPGYVLTINKPASGLGTALYQKRERWDGVYREHVLALQQCESNVWQFSGSRRYSVLGCTFWHSSGLVMTITNSQ